MKTNLSTCQDVEKKEKKIAQSMEYNLCKELENYHFERTNVHNVHVDLYI